MKPISIYIVEDELLISASLRAQLQHFVYEILGASTRGESCLEDIEKLSVQGREPEIILMDIHLRGELDGIETAKRINEKYNCGIIFLTGQSSKEVYERSFKIKPFGYLLKPIDMEQTKMTIEIASYQRNLELKNNEYQKNLETLLNLRTQEKNEIQQMYHAVLDNSMMGIIIASNEKIIYANKKCTDIFDHDIDDLLSRSPWEILSKFNQEDQQKMINPAKEYFSNQIKSHNIQLRTKLNNNRTKLLEVKIDTIEYQEKPALCISLLDISNFQNTHFFRKS